MASREKQLAIAKQKLQRFQQSRAPGSYSVHTAISTSSALNGQSLTGAGLVTNTTNATTAANTTTTTAAFASDNTTGDSLVRSSSRSSSISGSSIRQQIMSLPPTMPLRPLSHSDSHPGMQLQYEMGVSSAASGHSDSESRASRGSRSSMTGIALDYSAAAAAAEINHLVPMGQSSNTTRLPVEVGYYPSSAHPIAGLHPAAARSVSISGSSGRRVSTSSNPRDASQDIHVQYVTRIEALEAELKDYRSRHDTDLDMPDIGSLTLKTPLEAAEIKYVERDHQPGRDDNKVEESQTRIRSLEEEISGLSRQRDVLEEQLTEARSAQSLSSPRSASLKLLEIESLQSQLLECQAMTETLRADAKEAHLQITELLNVKKVLENAIESMKETPNALSTSEATESVFSSSEEVKRLQDIISEHEPLLSYLRQQIAELEEKSQQETQCHVKFQEEIVRLTDLVQTTTDALHEVQERLAEVESNSKRQVSELLSQIETLEADLAKSKTSGNESQPINVNDDWDWDGSESNASLELQQAREEIRQLKTQLSVQALELDTTFKKNLDLVAQLDAAVCEREDFSAKLDAATEQRVALQAILDGMSLDLPLMGADHAAETLELHNKIEQVSAENTRLQAEIDQLSAEASADVVVINSLEPSQDTSEGAESTSIKDHTLAMRIKELEQSAISTTDAHTLAIKSMEDAIQWVEEEKQAIIADYEVTIHELQDQVKAIGLERDELVAEQKERGSSNNRGMHADGASDSFEQSMNLELELDPLNTKLTTTRDEHDPIKDDLHAVNDSPKEQKIEAQLKTVTTEESDHQISPLNQERSVVQLSSPLSSDSADLAPSMADLIMQLKLVEVERDTLSQRLLLVEAKLASKGEDVDALYQEPNSATAKDKDSIGDAESPQSVLYVPKEQMSRDQDQPMDTISTLVESDHALRQRLVESESEIEMLKLRIADLTMDSNKEVPRESDGAHDSEHQKKIDELCTKLDYYETQLANIEAQHFETIKDRDAEIEKLREQSTAVIKEDSDQDSSNDPMSSAKDRLAAVQALLEEQTAATEEISINMANLQEQLTYYQEEKEYFEGHCDELDAVILSNCTKFEEELVKLETKQAELINEIQQSKEQAEISNQDYSQKLELAQAEISGLVVDRDALTLSLNQENDKVQSLMADLADAMRLSEMANASKQEVDQLKQQIETLESGIVATEAELETMRQVSQQWEDYATDSLEDANVLHAEEMEKYNERQRALELEIDQLSLKLQQAQHEAETTIESMSLQNQNLLSDKDTLALSMSELQKSTDLEAASLTQKHSQACVQLDQIRAEKSDIESQLQDITVRHDVLSQEHHTLISLKTELEQQHSKCTTEIEELTHSKFNSEARINQLDQEVEDLRTSIVTSQAVHEKDQQSMHDLDEKLSEHVHRVEQLQSEKQASQQLLDASSESLELLREEVRKMTVLKDEYDLDKDESEQEILVLTQRIEEAQEIIAEWQAYVQTFDSDRTVWESERAALESRLNESLSDQTAQTHSLSEELSQIKEERDHLIQIQDEQNQKLADAIHEQSRLSECLANLERERSEQTHQLQILQERIDESSYIQTKLAEIEDENKHLRSSKEVMEEEHHRQSLQFKEEIDQHHQQSTFDQHALNQRISELELDLSKASQDLVALQERLMESTALQTKYDALEELHHELQLVKEQSQEQQNHLLSRLQEADSQLERLTELEQDHETKINEVERLSQESSKLWQDLEASRYDRDAALASLSNCEKDLAASQEKCTGIEQDLYTIRSQNDTEIPMLQSENSRLASHVSELESHVSYYQEQVSQTDIAARGTLEELQTLQSHHSALQADYQTCQQELYNARESNSNSIDSLRSNYEEQKALLERRVDEMASQLSYQTAESQQLSSSLQEAQHQHATMLEQHYIVEAEFNSTKEANLETIGSLSADLSQRNTDFAKLKSEVERLEAEKVVVAADSSKAKAKVHDLEQSLSLTEETRNNLRRNLDEEIARASNLQQKQRESDDKIVKSDSLIATLRHQIDEFSLKLDDTVKAKSDIARQLEELSDIALQKDAQMDTTQAALSVANTQLALLQQIHTSDQAALLKARSLGDSADQLKSNLTETELADQKNALAMTQAKLLIAQRELASLEKLIKMRSVTRDTEANGIVADRVNVDHHSVGDLLSLNMDKFSAAEVASLRTEAADLQVRLTESDRLVGMLQPALDDLDDAHREVDRLSKIVHSLGVTFDESGGAIFPAPVLKPDVPAGMCQIPRAEYSELEAKAKDVDQSMIQLENTLALIEENDQEIRMLRETIDELLSDTSANMDLKTSDGAAKLLQRQVDELRKLWSHELAANSVLRNLIAKTQDDAHQYQQDSQRQLGRLREECDELVNMCEETQQSADATRSELKACEANLRQNERRIEARLNGQHIDHHNQLATQYELHSKERSALTKLVGSLEVERDQLAADLHRIKSRHQTHSTDWSRDFDGLKRRLAEKEAALYEAEANLHQCELKVRDTEFQLHDCDVNLKKIEQTHQDIVADLDSRLHHADLHARHIESKLKNAEFALAKAHADAARLSQEAAYASERYHSMEETYRQMTDANHMQHNQEDMDAHRHAWLSERFHLESELKKKHMEILDRDQDAIEERQRMRSIADEEIRGAVAAEQRHARDILNSKITEIRTKYDAALDDLRAQKRKVEEQLDETEHTLFEERDLLQRRLFEAEDRERVHSAELTIAQDRLARKEQLHQERQTVDGLTVRAEKWHAEKLQLEMRITQLELDFDVERRNLQKQVDEAWTEGRLTTQKLADRDAAWTTERECLNREIARIREDAANLAAQIKSNDSNGFMKSLQEQKSNLEAILHEREAKLLALEVRLQEQTSRSVEAEDHLRRIQTQNHNFELQIIERDEQLLSAQAQLRALTDCLDHLDNKDLPSPGVSQQQHQQQLDETKRQADAQIKFERDRAKRLAHKIEELKSRNQQIKKQLEIHNQPIIHNDQPATEEIEVMRRELSSLRVLNGEVLAILRDTLVDTVGPGAIDIPDPEVNSVRLNLPKLKEQCGDLVQEVVHMRAHINRLVIWRGDLKYQKLYLSLKLEDLMESQKATLAFINGMGVTLGNQDSISKTPPKTKLIRCVHAVIAVGRMKGMARRWQEFLYDNGRLNLAELRGPEREYDRIGSFPTHGQAYISRRLSFGDSGSPTQTQRMRELERDLHQARAGQAAIEERLNEELYEKRAVEMENERLLRALKYDRHNLPPVIYSTMHTAHDRMSPAPLSASGSISHSIHRDDYSRYPHGLAQGITDDRSMSHNQYSSPGGPPDNRWSQHTQRFR
ncbi:hypothetical protein BASA50_011352 [Batrachochytrium salamandrivorans]|uniref:Pericentrin/AKAP-450 centrosomal targeting domain-containing protein n=1 Tax=Batrachochytrium salamandrivorans TaxID=1357716 RepID=A0ABQ8EW13_9FUNG|nr:hypothetical protein BASA50_011352 [Batrachochytrium salamandrivorans]